MRVLVDTSVWADFFNRYRSPEAELLTRLIEDEADLVTCGVVERFSERPRDCVPAVRVQP